jgi:hypothetical protein
MGAISGISIDPQRIFDTGGIETPQALHYLRVHGRRCEELVSSTTDLSTNGAGWLTGEPDDSLIGSLRDCKAELERRGYIAPSRPQNPTSLLKSIFADHQNLRI